MKDFLDSVGFDAGRIEESVIGYGLAIESKDCSLLEFLIQKGAKISHADEDGNTLLMYSQAHSPMMTSLLIRKGTKVNIVNKKQQTPMGKILLCWRQYIIFLRLDSKDYLRGHVR